MLEKSADRRFFIIDVFIAITIKQLKIF